MAADFERTSEQRFDVSLPAESGKLSFAYIFKHESVPGSGHPDRQISLARGNTAGDSFNYLSLHADTLFEFAWSSAAGVFHVVQGAWTANTNEHTVVFVADWDSDAFAIYLDGVTTSATLVAGSASSVPETSIASLIEWIGAFSAGGVDAEHFDGTISEFVLWQGVALTAADAVAFHKRFTQGIRPNGRRRYWPFVRQFNEVIGRTTVTDVNGVTPAEHPRVIRQRGRQRSPSFDDVAVQTLFPAHFAKRSYVALVTQ